MNWKDIIYIVNTRSSSCTHFRLGAHSALNSAMQSVGYIKTQFKRLGFGMRSFAHWGAACPSNIQPACFPAQRLSSSKGGSGGSIIQKCSSRLLRRDCNRGRLCLLGKLQVTTSVICTATKHQRRSQKMQCYQVNQSHSLQSMSLQCAVTFLGMHIRLWHRACTYAETLL